VKTTYSLAVSSQRKYAAAYDHFLHVLNMWMNIRQN
jgi:hypothetical protein